MVTQIIILELDNLDSLLEKLNESESALRKPELFAPSNQEKRNKNF
jgi:hypothetical protein